MELGVCVASHIGDIDYVVRAEELGYSHAWLADSQMIWSDCYATLALAAVRTQRIHIGTRMPSTLAPSRRAICSRADWSARRARRPASCWLAGLAKCWHDALAMASAARGSRGVVALLSK